MTKFLYRGVDRELYKRLDGQLRPKQSTPFVRHAKFGRAAFGIAQFGKTLVNGVFEHQFDQQGLPTSGISTTPHIERAKHYATSGGKCSEGYIYVIDRECLASFAVTAYPVRNYVKFPSVPMDDEVILVAKNFGTIPKEVVLEVLMLDAQGCLEPVRPE